jgi:hypothetical protein
MQKSRKFTSDAGWVEAPSLTEEGDGSFSAWHVAGDTVPFEPHHSPGGRERFYAPFLRRGKLKNDPGHTARKLQKSLNLAATGSQTQRDPL